MPAIIILFWFAQYVYIPFQTPYLTILNISTTFIGIIVGAYGVSQMLFRLPVGMMADTVNKHKYFILAGCVSSGLASIFRIVLDSGTGYLIANLFSGFASAMWISFMILYLSFYSPDKQQQGTGKIMYYNYLGILIAFIASTLLYDKMGMPFLCALGVIAGLLGAVLTLFLKEEKTQPAVAKPSVSTLFKSLGKKTLIIFSLLTIAVKGIETTTTMSFTNQILKDLGGSSLIIGCSSVIFMLSSVISSGIASKDICSKRPPLFWAVVGYACLIAYCVLVPIVSNIYIILVLQLLPGIPSGILFSFLTAEAMQDVQPEHKSTAMGFFQAVYAIGMTVLPIITGKIADTVSMAAGYLVLAAISALCILIACIYYSRNKKILKK